MSHTTAPTLSFDNASIATGYDAVLAPALFEPWADRLVRDHRPWAGLRVLDLATGTGVVAERLAAAGAEVTGADMNAQMLAVARDRCGASVRFVESAAHPLQLEDDSVDVVVCQQGFQFFPDKQEAAREMARVLRPGGRIVATTWLPVRDCEIFGALCDALDSVGEPDLARQMRMPFDHLPAADLAAPFELAGFGDLRLRRLEMGMVMPGGVARAIEFAYATPIGPAMRELAPEKQALLREIYAESIRALGGGASMGRMVTNELIASRTAR